MKKTFVFILVILLIGLVIYCGIRISRYKFEISNKNVEIDSLKKEISNLNFNYGLSLTKIHCRSCHGFRYKTDNPLEGVVQRVGERYLSLYLTNQDSLITANDLYAKSLKERWANMANAHNFKFSHAELKAIFAFMT